MTNYAEKITALLAKAASTEHEAERDTFTEAAERLMVKWGVSDAMLADADTARRRAPSTIETRRYYVPGTSGALLAELVAQRAAAGVGPVRCLYSHGRPVWWAIGYPDDLARVELYVPHVVTQARAAWKRHLRDSHGAAWVDGGYASARVAFLSSFGWAVHGRLSELFATEAQATDGAALVLANREAQLDAHLSAEFPNVKIRHRDTTNWAAAAAGYRAGQDATIAAGALS